MRKWSGGNGVTMVTNGPAFVAQMSRLSLAVSAPVLASAAQAGGEVIRDEWRVLAPELEGHYRDSIQVDVNPSAFGVLARGEALATIYPHEVPGVPDAEQPFRYAGILEFGGQLSAAQHNAYIPAQPSARPALDNKGDEAIDAVEDRLRAALAIAVL